MVAVEAEASTEAVAEAASMEAAGAVVSTAEG